MTAEERMALLGKQAVPLNKDEIDDLSYLFPAPKKIKIGERTYSLYAYPLKKIYLLLTANEALTDIDRTVEWLGETLNESDIEYIRNNVDTEQVEDIVDIVNKINTPPDSSVQQESSSSFGAGFRWNVHMLMDANRYGMSFEDVSYLTLPQLVILRQCIREVDDAQKIELAKLAAQQSLLGRK